LFVLGHECGWSVRGIYQQLVVVVVVVGLFNVCRQPKAAKDGPGFMPWQAYHTQKDTRKEEREAMLAPEAKPPRDHQGALWPMPLNGGKRRKRLYST
jgi:hypothetical protein